jgi:four helix bundle protein
MEEFRFLDWKAYKDAKSLVKEIYSITRTFPQDFKYDIGSQINRSSTSVALNIAEGSGKNSDKDMGRFFDIAIGSTYETIAGLDMALDNQLISERKFIQLSEEFKSVARQLGGFKKRLRSKN